MYLHISKTGGFSLRRALPPVGEPTCGEITIGEALDRYKNSPQDYWTVIRNPYDRAVSVYGHVLRLLDDGHKVTKEGLKRFWIDGRMPELPFDKKYDLLTTTQVSRISIDDKIIVPTLVLFTDIQEYVMERWGVTLPHLHKSPREPGWMQYYDDELQEYIRYRFEDDFVKLGFIA